MQRIIVRILLTLILCAGFMGQWAATPTSTKAEAYLTENVSCKPLDIIFILDESPERISWVFDVLALQSLTSCKNVTNQVAVITTQLNKDGNYISLSLTPLIPTSLSAWQSEREGLLKPVLDSSSVRGNRDFKGAFAEAGEIAAKSRSKSKKLVIYLGSSYPTVTSSSTKAQMQKEISEATQLFLSKSGAKEDGTIEFWGLFTPHGSYDSVYSSWTEPTWNSFVEQLGGEAVQPSEFKHLHQYSGKIIEILAAASGFSDLQPFSCGEYQINPYQGNMLVVTFSDDEKVPVTVEHEILSRDFSSMVNAQGDLEDELIYLSDDSWHLNNVMLFKDPPSNNWRVSAGSRCNALSGFRQGGSVRVEIQGPTQALPQYNLEGKINDPSNPFRYSLNIIDSLTGSVVRLEENILPKVEMRVTQPDGANKDLFFWLDSNGKLASDPLPVSESGEYHWTAKINLPFYNDSGQLEYSTPFGDLQGSYNVYPITNLTLSILSPENKIYPVHDNLLPGKLSPISIPVEIQLIDEEGQSVNPVKVFDKTEQSIQVWFETKTGEKSQTVWLTTDSENSTSHLIGRAGADLLKASAYTAHFEVKGKYDQVNYRIPYPNVEAPFNREDNFWSNPSIWFGIAAVLAGLLFLLVIYGLSFFLNPLQGEIAFVTTGVHASVANFTLGIFSYLRFSHRRLVAKSPILKDIEWVRVRQASDGRINVELLLNNGKKQGANLSANDILPVNPILILEYRNSNVKAVSQSVSTPQSNPDQISKEEKDYA